MRAGALPRKSRSRKVSIRGFKYVMSAPNGVVMHYVLNVNKHSVRIAGIEFITKVHAYGIDKEVFSLLNFTRHMLGARPALLINRALAVRRSKTP